MLKLTSKKKTCCTKKKACLAGFTASIILIITCLSVLYYCPQLSPITESLILLLMSIGICGLPISGICYTLSGSNHNTETNIVIEHEQENSNDNQKSLLQNYSKSVTLHADQTNKIFITYQKNSASKAYLKRENFINNNTSTTTSTATHKNHSI